MLFPDVQRPLVKRFRFRDHAARPVIVRQVVEAQRLFYPASIEVSYIADQAPGTIEQVSTLEGKKQMLADGLSEIQGVMNDQIGEAGVEAVYFTALVIQ